MASFSVTGVVFSIAWLFFCVTYPEFSKMYMIFFITQTTALIAGPFVFVALKSDMLTYMRHVVGLVYLPFGCLLIISGLVAHSYPANQFKDYKNRPAQTGNANE